MRATRLVLVLILLSAMTRSGEAQLLPRRRVAVRVGEMMADFGARVTMEGMKEGLNQATRELGDVLDLQLSLELYAQIQMGPQAKLHMKGGAEQDRPRHDSLSLLLAETARLAARLQEEKFSPPVLETMVLDYQGIASVKPTTGDVPGSWSSRQIFLGGPFAKGEDLSGRRSVTCLERHQPLDPSGKSPKSVHCSFVFLTRKESQEVQKTVDFDLQLDKQQTAGPRPASPWKVKNVEYDRPVPEPKVSGQSTQY